MKITSRLPLVPAFVIVFTLGSHAMDIGSLLERRMLSGDLKDIAPTDPLLAPDNSIDGDAYLIGGGDAFQISLVGLPSQEFFPVVNESGDLYISDFGVIKVGKVPLNKAKELIAQHVRKKLRNAHEVYVTLKSIKRPVVTVTGAVISPGTFQMPGTMRVLDAIKMANGGTIPFGDAFDYRRVTCRNRDADTTYDLLRALAKQDFSQNPYVYPGNNIHLTPVDRYIYVLGEVSGLPADKIPLRPGETLADLLQVVTLKAAADSGYILVRRSRGETKRVSVAEAASIRIEDRDVITFGAKEGYLKPAMATAAGEVMRPATYPISEKGVSAAEVLSMAGGPGPLGNLERAFVIKASRISPKTETPPPDPRLPRGLPQKLPQGTDQALASLRRIRPEMSASLNDLAATSDYTIIELGKNAGSVTVEDGDIVEVPRRNPYIYVSGSVANPGAYPYKAGASWSDYVRTAGGYNSNADKTNSFVLSLYHGMAKIKGTNKVAEGDVIVVPASVEHKTFSTVMLPLLQTVPVILNVVLTFMLLNK